MRSPEIGSLAANEPLLSDRVFLWESRQGAYSPPDTEAFDDREKSHATSLTGMRDRRSTLIDVRL